MGKCYLKASNSRQPKGKPEGSIDEQKAGREDNGIIRGKRRKGGLEALARREEA